MRLISLNEKRNIIKNNKHVINTLNSKESVVKNKKEIW